MNASKENARKAGQTLESAAQDLDTIIDKVGLTVVNNIKGKLANIQEFLLTAERKLPTEAAYARDKKRSTSAKKLVKAGK